MTKKLLMLLALLLLASTGCSRRPRTAAPAAGWWVPISAGFGMAIASGLCGLAQAKAVAASAEGMARNPGAAGAIRFALLIGLVLIESLALYTLVIIILKVSPNGPVNESGADASRSRIHSFDPPLPSVTPKSSTAELPALEYPGLLTPLRATP